MVQNPRSLLRGSSIASSSNEHRTYIKDERDFLVVLHNGFDISNVIESLENKTPIIFGNKEITPVQFCEIILNFYYEEKEKIKKMISINDKNNKSVVKTGFVQKAEELYGEQRGFTKDESELYKKITNDKSEPLNYNVYDHYTDKFVPAKKEKDVYSSNTTELNQKKNFAYKADYELWRRECINE